jgi:hypothetical protein
MGTFFKGAPSNNIGAQLLNLAAGIAIEIYLPHGTINNDSILIEAVAEKEKWSIFETHHEVKL